MSYDSREKQYSGQSSEGGGTSTRDVERRRADRHTFTAAAEVVELDSGARFSTRTTDLGPGGCFVDTMVPFPVGSKVRVSVRKGKTQFEADGAVVYSQVGLGMGIAFDALDPSQREALDTWLSELTAGRQGSHREAARPSQNLAAVGSIANHAVVVRLIQLLIGKGLLTEAEGASILHDPVL
ncbi:MAG: PilZ domain-containing protein [Candidatus Acidiferrales bacterium]|jgi:hypothetical protein